MENSNIKERIDYYNSLGAKIVGYRYFFYPVANLSYENINFTIFTEGTRGTHSLVLQTYVKTFGYIKLAKKNFWDMLFFQKEYKELFIEYDDEIWANKLLSLSEFEDFVAKLFKKSSVSWFEIKGNLLRVGWFIGKGPAEVGTAEFFEIINVIKNLLDTLNNLPRSEKYKEDARNWLIMKIPIISTIFLSIVEILGGFYQYLPTCLFNMLSTGYKVTLPFIIFYIFLCLLLVGGPTAFRRVFLTVSFVLFICNFFITLFFLTYINGKFDSSPIEIKRDIVEKKYISPKRGPRLILRDFHSKNHWCESFNVSEDFYNKVQVGSIVEYKTKKGLLGVEWFYSKLYIVK